MPLGPRWRVSYWELYLHRGNWPEQWCFDDIVWSPGSKYDRNQQLKSNVFGITQNNFKYQLLLNSIAIISITWQIFEN